jgi:hypothetical protein
MRIGEQLPRQIEQSRVQSPNRFAPRTPTIKGEAMARNNLPANDLPPEARELIESSEKAVAAVRKKAEREVKAIQKKVREQAAEIQDKADEVVKQHQQRLLEGLQPLKESYAREGRFDEAVAVYEQIRLLKAEVARGSSLTRGPAVICRMSSRARATFLKSPAPPRAPFGGPTFTPLTPGWPPRRSMRVS